jgi:hypothetical protein
MPPLRLHGSVPPPSLLFHASSCLRHASTTRQYSSVTFLSCLSYACYTSVTSSRLRHASVTTLSRLTFASVTPPNLFHGFFTGVLHFRYACFTYPSHPWRHCQASPPSRRSEASVTWQSRLLHVCHVFMRLESCLIYASVTFPWLHRQVFWLETRLRHDTPCLPDSSITPNSRFSHDLFTPITPEPRLSNFSVKSHASLILTLSFPHAFVTPLTHLFNALLTPQLNLFNASVTP